MNIDRWVRLKGREGKLETREGERGKNELDGLPRRSSGGSRLGAGNGVDDGGGSSVIKEIKGVSEELRENENM